MGEGKDTVDSVTAIGMIDMGKLSEALEERLGDQVKCVVQLNPDAPMIAFSFPDCGSEEMAYKARTMGAIMSQAIDQIFRWNADGYEGGDDDEHDPSIA